MEYMVYKDSLRPATTRGDVLDVFRSQVPEAVGPCNTEDGAEQGEAAHQGDVHGGSLRLPGKVALEPLDHPISSRLGQGQVVAPGPRGLHDGPEVDTGGSEGALSCR